ncbi:MAG TPA: zf-HC2 domain-containing protein, partial [Candidatus Aquicultoraceae bacterium]|nr:zf-HC2 domain-containing protein [Candidatus Aquicultoraceae bacterium]
MNCADTRDALSGYLDGDLPDGDRERISQHLRQCSRCAGEERALRETLSLVGTLPALAAPPELLEGVLRRIERETPSHLRKRRFSLARVKIPLEVAAAALIVLAVYGIQKEMPSGGPPAVSTAPAESGAREVKAAQATRKPPRAPAGPREPEAGFPARADRSGAGAAPAKPLPEEREGKSMTPGAGEREAASPREGRESVPAPVRGKPSKALRSEIAPGLAARVSTGGGTIGTERSEESAGGEIRAFRVFAEPASRMLRPSALEREVTIAVDRDSMPGIEDRIAQLADRLGGSVRGEWTRVPAGQADGQSPYPDAVRVRIPLVFADIFLEELG